jgi:hypothetical protein
MSLPRTCATARPQLAKADTAFQGVSVGQPTEPCLAPLLLALLRLARRVLRLEPHLRRPAAMGRISPLRHDALQPHAADMGKHGRPSPVRCSVNRMARRLDLPISLASRLISSSHTVEKTLFFARRVTLGSPVIRFTVMIVRCGPVVDRRLRWRVRSGLSGRGRS